MKKSLKVCLLLSVNLFLVIVANAGGEEQKVDDRFPFGDLPDELQDNIWEKVGSDIPPITKNLLLKSYCRKISNQGENCDPTKAKIIANNLDPLTAKRSIAQDVLQLPEAIQKEIGRYFTRIHNYKLFKQLKIFLGPCYLKVKGISFDSAGNLISWSNDNSIRIRDIETGQILNEFFVNDFIGCGVQNVILDKKGRLFAFIVDGTIKIWDFASKKLLKTIENPGNWAYPMFLVNSNIILDKKGHLFSCYDLFTIKMWDLDSGICLRKFSHDYPEVIDDFILDESNKKLLSRSRNYGKVYIWDIANEECLRSTIFSDSIIVENFMLNKNDLFLFCKNENAVLRLNLNDNTCVKFKGHEGSVLGGKLDKEKRLLFTYSEDKTIRLWNIDSRECLKIFEFPSNGILGITLDEQGKLISWSCREYTIRIWDIETGKCINTLTKQRKKIRDVLLDRKGRLFFPCDKYIHMWGPPETLEEKMMAYVNYTQQEY